MLNKILTYFTKILPITLLGFVLQSCSDTLDDEKYATIEGGFPKLVDVPDRPKTMSSRDIDQKKHQLDADRLEAEKLAEQNYKMATK